MAIEVSVKIYYRLESHRCDMMGDKPKLDLGLLEEDDEFEEFPAENWTAEDADDEDVSVWEDNWEDDNIQDDFNQQLRAQLEQQKMQTN